MDPVKVGIIGIGNMGSAHTSFVEKSSLCQLNAVCDANTKAFDRICESARDRVAKYTDVDRFLAEADVELVMIAVPHYDHPRLAIKAMNAGKHIIVEKPICVHKAAAEKLIAEAAKHPELVKSAMFNQRMRGAHKKIKAMIDNGELGKITRINWIITDWFRTQHYYDSGDWRASWRGEGGGVLLNQCPHQLDLMQWFFGLPSKVRASVKLGKYHDIEVEDEVNAYLEYPDGKVGNFIASTGEMPGTNRLEITAERGRLVFENGKLEFLRNEIGTAEFCRTTKSSFDTAPCWKCEIPYKDSAIPEHRQIIENVAGAIRNGTPLMAPVEEGIRGLELGNSILLSGLKEKTVEFPMDSAEYETMLEELIASSRYQKKAVVSQEIDDSFNSSF